MSVKNRINQNFIFFKTYKKRRISKPSNMRGAKITQIRLKKRQFKRRNGVFWVKIIIPQIFLKDTLGVIRLCSFSLRKISYFLPCTFLAFDRCALEISKVLKKSTLTNIYPFLTILYFKNHYKPY